ncbi:MAG: LysR family transcriptional regulator [Lachnospiraceae bacterium]|nr:LysR family transcriptional regulator [Lachnospiraceae bacterium]
MNWDTTNLSYQQMNIFLTIMEKGNFAQAADALYMSSSTISKNIARLEKEFGFELFTRNTRTVKPTPMANILYQSWSVAVREIKNGYLKAKEESEEDSRILNIAIPNTSNPQRYLWPKTQDFLAENPGTILNIASRNWNELIEEVLEGTYDIAFIPDFDSFTLDEKEMPWTYTAKAAAEAIVAGNHPLSKKQELTLADILEEQLIVYDDSVDPDYQRWLGDIYTEQGAEPRIGKYSDNIFAGHSYSLSNQLIQIGDHYFQFAGNTESRRIPITDLQNGIIITWHPNLRKEIAKKYIEYMKLV